ncbi:MAG: molybdopterin-guanine dinucleotide biosynthesis protein MobB, partial [Planctomycetes bacterium]|nr:molybdopterin-guanine dinucleotide biosynthesis protein MobB [Planctomycetota bacterium]
MLARMGLKVAVVKCDAHGPDADRPGKDSDRFFQAGADVLLQGQQEVFFRTHIADGDDWSAQLVALAERYDLVLVEGGKAAAWPKVWLAGPDEKGPPSDITQLQGILDRDSNRLEAVLSMIEGFLASQWLKTPVFGCVLIGGLSTRMGRSKHLLIDDGQTWLERAVRLLRQFCRSVAVAGAGEIPPALAGVPHLADVPDAEGPMSGLLAAMRWYPNVSWLIAACDLPALSAEVFPWLLSTRRPGVWATMPAASKSPGPEPLLAHYDFR